MIFQNINSELLNSLGIDNSIEEGNDNNKIHRISSTAPVRHVIYRIGKPITDGG